jgi:hypothetical protein
VTAHAPRTRWAIAAATVTVAALMAPPARAATVEIEVVNLPSAVKMHLGMYRHLGKSWWTVSRRRHFTIRNVKPGIVHVTAEPIRFYRRAGKYRRGDTAHFRRLLVDGRVAAILPIVSYRPDGRYHIKSDQRTIHMRVRFKRRPQPKPIEGATGVSVGGEQVVCAAIAGDAKCWDDGHAGTVIRGGVLQVSAADQHACALMTSGKVLCWGHNDRSQLGDGGTTNSNIPITAIAAGATQVSADESYNGTCALLSGGEVRCWGYESKPPATGETPIYTYLDLGDTGNRPDADTRTQYTVIPSGAREVRGNCAIMQTDSRVVCWGYWEGPPPAPGVVDAQMRAPYTKISSGAVHLSEHGTCATLSNGQTQCWDATGVPYPGGGGESALWRPFPVTIPQAAGADVIAPAWAYNCFVVAGAVKCWGEQHNGALGNGRTRGKWLEEPVTTIRSGATSVSTSLDTACAVVRGAIKCWGDLNIGDGLRGILGGASIPINVQRIP